MPPLHNRRHPLLFCGIPSVPPDRAWGRRCRAWPRVRGAPDRSCPCMAVFREAFRNRGGADVGRAARKVGELSGDGQRPRAVAGRPGHPVPVGDELSAGERGTRHASASRSQPRGKTRPSRYAGLWPAARGPSRPPRVRPAGNAVGPRICRAAGAGGLSCQDPGPPEPNGLPWILQGQRPACQSHQALHPAHVPKLRFEPS
jgi:hypothetical protein